MAMIKVGCKIPNGIMLQLFRGSEVEGPFRTMVKDGPGVRLAGPSSLQTGVNNTGGIGLAPVITEVDGEWWAKWAAQNEHNLLFAEGAIFEVKDE